MLDILFLSILSSTAVSPVDCDKLLEQGKPAAMQMDYEHFDQTEGSGFRVLAAAGCPRQAANLIASYIEATGDARSSLHWHLAQMRAEAGQTPAAIDAARASMRELPAGETFRWNEYVRAVIAFLEKDRKAFDREFAAVSQASGEHPGNAMNLRFLGRLASNFDKTYLEAVLAGE